MPTPDLARSPDPNKASVCLSDLHLESADEPAFRTLSNQLAAAANAGHNVFLLGDLCEVWVGDDDDGPLACAFRSLITSTSTRSFVGLMHGNRDFLFGERFAMETGAVLLPDPYPLGEQILLSHGDRYCTDDTEYQQMRALLRSKQWQESVLQQSLPERRQLAAGLRQQSQEASANKAANIMDVNAKVVATEMAQESRGLLVHGHTHRPGRHQLDGFERLVLGDWAHTAWVAEIGAGVGYRAQSQPQLSAGVTLRCLPLA
ncbi:MAG: UDP-2,3-diacylglucosamine diphosphatase [Pseudomonadales bacterium]